MAENFFEKAGTFASDAAIDTAADAEINKVVDGVASHVPGGGAVDAMLKTGIDLAANNAINAEVGKLEGMFGHHEAAPAAADTADTSAADDTMTSASSDDQN
jgi:hypothetical protein